MVLVRYCRYLCNYRGDDAWFNDRVVRAQPPCYVQCVLFALVALLLLFFTRPIALKFLHTKREKTNADSLIGKKAVVLQTITEWEKGQVKINGVVWTASSVDGAVIHAGDECIIEKIEGVTLIVKEMDASEN